ncbi:MAG: hypothetical protein CL763_00335 [Chloroflexi bacterium]|nr:hypothetical protein [Chloroflexota bacterium]|tara:strand:- start:12481 stop:13089 length:609 start_codon:yes stop_codon:yes gene_type:complete
MISSRLNGKVLIAGIIGWVLVAASWIVQGDHSTLADTIKWAAGSDDWQNVGMIRMLGFFLFVVFLSGYSAWAKKIDESSSTISVGVYFALLGVIFMFVSLVTEMAGYDSASDNNVIASTLIGVSQTSVWFGGTFWALSLLLVGLRAARLNAGNSILLWLLSLLGLVALVGNFVEDMVWVLSFGLSMLILAYIGLTTSTADKN